jgi:hypothetical protein
MGDLMLTQPTGSAMLVLGAHDTMDAGTLALAVPGVSCVTTDPDRGQVLIRYNPQQVAADRILRAVRPGPDDEMAHAKLLLTAWPTLAKALPVAASLL